MIAQLFGVTVCGAFLPEENTRATVESKSTTTVPWCHGPSPAFHARTNSSPANRSTLPGLPDGGWLSAYDGYTTSDPSELDIDHVVPLGEAWRSGASRWDPARRAAFANDLDAPQALIAVTAATNRSKSDSDPAIWQPPNTNHWCA